MSTSTATEVCIGLGSNLGDRAANLREALARLRPVVTGLVVSSVYETAPVGYIDQPLFLNMACRGRTELSPTELLARAKQIEHDMGRRQDQGPRFGPRIIDIDILLYGQLGLEASPGPPHPPSHIPHPTSAADSGPPAPPSETGELTIPHPRMHERAFVLVPLAEIAPEWVHPLLGKTVQELLELVGPEGVKRFSTSGRG